MTTDGDEQPSGDAAADRLARLAARRRAVSGGGPAETESGAATTPPARRVRPARSAKIVTVGASTTAMLGMMAGLAIADRPPVQQSAAAALQPPITQPLTSPAPTPTLPPSPTPTTTTAPLPVPAPLVIELATTTPAPPVTAPPVEAPPAPPVATTQGS